MCENKKNRLISFEGIPGSGKSAIIAKVKEKIEEMGYSVFTYDCIKYQNEFYLLAITSDENFSDMRMIDATYLFSLNKFIISPALEKYDFIILENYFHYFTTKYAHEKNSDSKVEALKNIIEKPDYTFYVYKTVEECLKNLSKRRAVGFWESGIDIDDNSVISSLSEYYRGTIGYKELSESFICYQEKLQTCFLENMKDDKVTIIRNQEIDYDGLASIIVNNKVNYKENDHGSERIMCASN